MRNTIHKVSNGQQLSFDEAVQYLYSGLASSSTAMFRGGAGLLRARYFYDMLGQPQEHYKSVHIAGTSGKGSVAHILTHLLTAHGFTTGTFTSPHAYDIRERVLINGEMLSRQEFAHATSGAISHALKIQQSRHGSPTFFEVITGVAFRVFADKHVSYAIIETGLGGLYDSTNTIERSDKLAVISTLGLDHTEILGDTLAKIASQKAGIMPFHGQAVAWQPDDEDAQKMLTSTAQKRQTHLNLISPDIYTMHFVTQAGTLFDYHSANLTITQIQLSLYGEHQAQNASLALQCLEKLAERDGFTIDEASVRQALAAIFIPARFERRQQGKRELIFDGAHNPQKMRALVNALSSTSTRKADWILALKESKDVQGVLEIIKPHVTTFYATTFLNSSNDTPLNAVPAEKLAQLARNAGITQVETVSDCRDALDIAYRNDNHVPIIISGSFHLAGDLRQQLP